MHSVSERFVVSETFEPVSADDSFEVIIFFSSVHEHRDKLNITIIKNENIRFIIIPSLCKKIRICIITHFSIYKLAIQVNIKNNEHHHDINKTFYLRCDLLGDSDNI